MIKQASMIKLIIINIALDLSQKAKKYTPRQYCVIENSADIVQQTQQEK